MQAEVETHLLQWDLDSYQMTMVTLKLVDSYHTTLVALDS